MFRLSIFLIVLFALIGGTARDLTERPAPSPATPAQEVAAVLDDWHEAAASAELERYLGHFAPRAVFMGTDATERWSVAEFRAYLEKPFGEGRGFRFVSRDRFINFNEDGSVAWIDEQLDSDHMGVCRGSGVLLKTGDEWRIVHYVLSYPIPNDLADTIEKLIKAHEEGGEGG